MLLLGPLCRLTDRADRIAALREAVRVVHPGGVVFAAAISRFASRFDGLSRGVLFEAGFRVVVERDLADGRHRNPSATRTGSPPPTSTSPTSSAPRPPTPALRSLRCWGRGPGGLAAAALLLGGPASVVQRKVLMLNDLGDLAEVERRLLGFQRRYEQTAAPFNWHYTRADLERPLCRLDEKEQLTRAA